MNYMALPFLRPKTDGFYGDVMPLYPWTGIIDGLGRDDLLMAS